MFFGIPQAYSIDVDGFYFEEYLFGYFLLESKTSGQPQQSPPPMGNRNRPIVPSTVPAGPIARRGGRHNAIFNIRYGSGDCHVGFYMKE